MNDIYTDHAVADRRTARLTAVAGATLAALGLWTFAKMALGVELWSPAASGRPSQDIGPANVAVAAITASLAAWALLAVLERLTPRARAVWTGVAVAVLLVSLGAPVSGDDITTANRLILVGLHVTVAAVLIPLMRRSSSPAGRRAERQDHAVPAPSQ